MAGNPLLPSAAQVRSAAIKFLGVASTQTPPLSVPVDQEGAAGVDAIDPRMEGHQAYFDYRGVETHGVPSPDYQHEDAEGYGPGHVDVIYDEKPKGGSVIDVRVIEDSAEQIAAWRGAQTVAPAAGGAALDIVNRMRNRTKLTLTNNHPTDGVWLGDGPSVSAYNGYYLMPGKDLTLSSTEQVFAISNTANAIPISVLTEYTQEA